jgi:hypothetical protein
MKISLLVYLSVISFIGTQVWAMEREEKHTPELTPEQLKELREAMSTPLGAFTPIYPRVTKEPEYEKFVSSPYEGYERHEYPIVTGSMKNVVIRENYPPARQKR